MGLGTGDTSVLVRDISMSEIYAQGVDFPEWARDRLQLGIFPIHFVNQDSSTLERRIRL